MADAFLSLSAADCREVLGVAADRSGRPTHLLEKDAWVVWALAALYGSPLGEHLVFKDTKRLDNTAQLRGLDEAAGKESQKLEVYTGQNTSVSGNVNSQTLPNTQVILCSDLGPGC